VRENTKGFDCQVEELSDAYTQLAIQGRGPWMRWRELTDAHLDGIKNYWFTHGTVCGLKNTFDRANGLHGRRWIEIYVPSDVATSERVWNEVLEAGKDLGLLPAAGRAQYAAAGSENGVVRARNQRENQRLGSGLER